MKKTITFLMFLLAMLMLTAGCSDPVQNDEPVNIAFILGIADGEAVLNSVEEISSLPAQPGTTYTFISNEGNPSLIGQPGIIPDFSDRGYTAEMMKRVRTGIRADIMNTLDTYSPSEPEIDLSSSIIMGVKALKASSEEARKDILVLHCSGRSTTGLIDMVDTPVFELDIPASVPEIARQMCLDLSFIDQIIWHSIGSFGGSQEAASEFEISKMKAFYSELFRELGAKVDINFIDELTTDYYQFNDTPVSCVAVQKIGSGLKAFVPEELVNGDDSDDDAAFIDPVVISNEQVKFIGDKAEFANEDAAYNVLKPIAEYLIEHDISLIIAGACAGDTDSEKTKTLSLERAERVREALILMGADPARLIAVGLACTGDPYHIYGAGVGDDPIASQNRKVIICDSRSDLANQILAKLP